MDKFYSDSDLKKLQKIELSILKDFVNTCEKYGLTYFLIGGSALGAVRHKGFIPWDDDIDIGLPRKDYEKFLSVVDAEFPDKYNIINAENYDNYPLFTTQLALRGTEFVIENFKDLKIPFGIYLDIFPFDGMCNDNRKAILHARKTWFWGKVQILASIKKPYVPFKGLKRCIVWTVTSLIHYILKLLRLSPQKLYRKTKKLSMKYNGDSNKRLDFFCNTNYMWEILHVKDLYPLRKVEFEGMEVNVPNKVDKYLTQHYGNYMELPPADKRKNHYPYRLNFGEYSSHVK